MNSFSVAKNPIISINNKALLYDVFSGSHWLYTIPVMELYEHEYELDNGRFLHYKKEPQKHEVIINFNNKRIGGEEFRHATQQMVQWVAEQSDDDWNFFLIPESVGVVHLNFSFSSAMVAVIFKMVWWG